MNNVELKLSILRAMGYILIIQDNQSIKSILYKVKLP